MVARTGRAEHGCKQHDWDNDTDSHRKLLSFSGNSRCLVKKKAGAREKKGDGSLLPRGNMSRGERGRSGWSGRARLVDALVLASRGLENLKAYRSKLNWWPTNGVSGCIAGPYLPGAFAALLARESGRLRCRSVPPMRPRPEIPMPNDSPSPLHVPSPAALA